MKIFVTVFLLGLAGCKTVPQFPVKWFFSHQDLVNQQIEIDATLKGEANCLH